jgi:hypothetical protein
MKIGIVLGIRPEIIIMTPVFGCLKKEICGNYKKSGKEILLYR